MPIPSGPTHWSPRPCERGFRVAPTFDLKEVHGAVDHALALGAIGFDAVKHLVLCRVEKRPPKLDLDVYPYLPRATVGKTSPASYLCLMDRGAP